MAGREEPCAAPPDLPDGVVGAWQSFPVYGFGGRVGNYVSHCFALNGNDAAAEVQGVQGVLGVSARLSVRRVWFWQSLHVDRPTLSVH